MYRVLTVFNSLWPSPKMLNNDTISYLTRIESYIDRLQNQSMLGTRLETTKPPCFNVITNPERLFSFRVDTRSQEFPVVSDNTINLLGLSTNIKLSRPSELWIYLGDADPDRIRAFSTFVEYNNPMSSLWVDPFDGKIALCDLASFILIENGNKMTVVKDIATLSTILSTTAPCVIKRTDNRYINCTFQYDADTQFRIRVRDNRR